MSTATIERKKTFDVFDTMVEKVDVLTPRNKGLVFSLVNGKTMDFKPGQFVQAYVPLSDGRTERTAYSIASSPSEGREFELCVTLVPGGSSSTFLHSLEVGKEVRFMGPLGRFVLPDKLERDLVFIATGSGIAPFRSMIHSLIEKNADQNVYLIFGNRFDEDILYQREWERLASRRPNFKFLFTLSRPRGTQNIRQGYVQDWIGSFIDSPPAHDFYICGLNKMIMDVQNKLISLNVPRQQIFYERYD